MSDVPFDGPMDYETEIGFLRRTNGELVEECDHYRDTVRDLRHDNDVMRAEIGRLTIELHKAKDFKPTIFAVIAQGGSVYVCEDKIAARSVLDELSSGVSVRVWRQPYIEYEKSTPIQSVGELQ